MNAIFILEWHCGLWKCVILTHECAFSIWIITSRRNVQHVLCASHIHFHHSCFSSVSGFLSFSSIIFCLYENQCSAWWVCVIQHRKHKVWIYFCFATLLCGGAVHPKSKFHCFLLALCWKNYTQVPKQRKPTMVMFSNANNIEDLSPYCIAC